MKYINKNYNLYHTVERNSPKESAMSRVVATTASGNPFPVNFPKVKISGTTP
jgi:hypothetical protein